MKDASEQREAARRRAVVSRVEPKCCKDHVMLEGGFVSSPDRVDVKVGEGATGVIERRVK